MKYIKTYENIFDDYLSRLDLLNQEKNKILPYIDKFLLLSDNKWGKWQIEIEGEVFEEDEHTMMDEFKGTRNFWIDDKGKFKVRFDYGGDQWEKAYKDVVFDSEDIKDLSLFIDNPESYLDAKKYNL